VAPNQEINRAFPKGAEGAAVEQRSSSGANMNNPNAKSKSAGTKEQVSCDREMRPGQ